MAATSVISLLSDESPSLVVSPRSLSDGRLAALIGALTAVFGSLADMYLPAAPQIAREFGASTGAVQFTFATTLFGLGVGHLIFGPIADSLGRRTSMLIGGAVFMLAALVAACSRSIEMLIVACFLRGLGSAIAIMIGRAIVRDLFDGAAASKFFSQMTVVMGLSPIVAPWLAGQILVVANWRMIFIAVAAFAALGLLFAAMALPETLPAKRRTRAGLSATARSFRGLLRDRRFLGYALIAGLSWGSNFAYLAGSPFVLIELHGISVQQYGLFVGANSCGFVGAAQLNRWLLRRFSVNAVLTGALALNAVAGLALGLCGASGSGGLPALAILLFLCISSVGLAFPNVMSAALSPFQRPGSASALLGATQYAVGGAAGALVSFFQNGTAGPMTAVVAACGLGGLIVSRALTRGGTSRTLLASDLEEGEESRLAVPSVS